MSLDRLIMRSILLDRRSRAVLREALMSVVYKGELENSNDIHSALNALKSNKKTEIVFVDFAIGRESIAQFIEELKTARLHGKLGIIVTVGRSGGDIGSRVVEMYLDGTDGFIHEPYSSENLREILVAVVERIRKQRLELRVRALRAIDFLAQEAGRHIDEIAKCHLDGTKPAPRTERALKTTSDSLAPLYEDYADDFAHILARVLSAREPFASPAAGERPRRAANIKSPHPGEVVRELMMRRGLTTERILPSMRISPEEFEKLLACVLPLTDQFARELSRVLGKTVGEWMGMQRRWDKEQGEKAYHVR